MDSFKDFCKKFKAKYADDYRCDFINESLPDYAFPWDGQNWEAIDYLESCGADSNCIKCYQELKDLYDLNV